MKGQQESLTTVVVKSGLHAPDNRNSHGSRQESWLTPRANEPTGDSTFVERNGDRGDHCSPSLTVQVSRQESWATPQSRDAKGAEGRMIRDGSASDLPSQTEVEDTGTWNRNNGKLNPRWVEVLQGVPVGWVMPSCVNPITPIAEPVQSMGGGNWMTPEALNSTGYQISNGQKILRLGSQVIQNSTPPVTIEPTNSAYSETELFQPQQNSHSELFGEN